MFVNGEGDQDSPSLRRSIGLDEVCGVLVGFSSQPDSLGVGVALVGVGPGVLGLAVEAHDGNVFHERMRI